MTDKLPTPADEFSPEDKAGGVVAQPISTEDATTAITSRRQAFRNIRRQLSNEDLASPGVQKILLDDLQQAEEKCEILSAYIERFHEADKRASVLDEQLKERNKTQAAIEITFGVGVGVGCAIMGLAPSFWDKQPNGLLALGIGLFLVLGASIARMVKR